MECFITWNNGDEFFDKNGKVITPEGYNFKLDIPPT